MELAFEKAIEEDNIENLRLLWKKNKSNVDVVALLRLAIEVSALDTLRYLLIKVGAEEDLSDLLVLATLTSAFSIVLADVRSRPESVLLQIARKMNSSSSRVDHQLRLLLLDSRIRVEEMSAEVVESLYLALKKDSVFLNNVELGYRLGTTIVQQYSRLTEQNLEGDDTCSLVLRQLILKRSKRSELMKWVLEVRREELIEAANHILAATVPNTYCVCVLRAMLLSMLYPTMDLREAIQLLKEDGYEGNTLADSAGLLGVYYTINA